MNSTRPEVEKAIYAKIVELARPLGHDARSLRPDQQIPATGWLDSASLMELMLWYETTYGLDIPQQDLNLENFGTIHAMADYLERCQAK
ncbi:MAG: acyl carrier protein [Acidobacteriaceae bacterium]|nr:acyl carrier protein [Acidobacteriaceae bacterium]MBV9499381.1 acyl carrier protein [Acidobacteriaceae bacterium]